MLPGRNMRALDRVCAVPRRGASRCSGPRGAAAFRDALG